MTQQLSETDEAANVQGFHFVHKDSKSTDFARNNGPDNASIRRHVQLVLGKRREQHTASILHGPSSTKNIAAAGWRRHESTLKHLSQDTAETSVEMVLSHNVHRDAGGGEATLSVEDEIDEVPSRPTYQNVSIPSCNIVPGDASDPFTVLPVTFDQAKRTILDFYLDNVLAGNHRNEMLVTGQSARQHRVFGSVLSRVKYILTNKTNTSTLLAATAARMSNMKHNQVFWEMQAGLCIHRALRSMYTDFQARHLNAPIDLDTVINILQLACAEWYRGNYHAASVHMKAIDSLGTSAGLFRVPVSQAREIVGLYDVFMSAETGSSPLFPLTWEPVGLSSERLNRLRWDLASSTGDHLHELHGPTVTIEALTSEDEVLERVSLCMATATPGSTKNHAIGRVQYIHHTTSPVGQSPLRQGFSEVVDEDILSEPMQSIVASHLVPWVAMVKFCYTHPTTPPVSDADWMSKTGIAILHRLLSIGRSHDSLVVSASSSRPSRKDLQEMLRLALVIAISQMSSPTFWRTAATNIRSLRYVMQRLEEHTMIAIAEAECHIDRSAMVPVSSPAQDRLWLWILLIGLSVSEANDDVEWFVDRAARAAVQLGLSCAAQITGLMQSYLNLWTPYLDQLVDRITALGKET